MMYWFIFEGLEIYNDFKDEEPKTKTIDVHVGLTCISPEDPPSGQFGPPEFYDPGSPAEWEVTEVQLVMDSCPPLDITPTQLEAMFPNGSDILNNAQESAAENGRPDN